MEELNRYYESLMRQWEKLSDIVVKNDLEHVQAFPLTIAGLGLISFIHTLMNKQSVTVIMFVLIGIVTLLFYEQYKLRKVCILNAQLFRIESELNRIVCLPDNSKLNKSFEYFSMTTIEYENKKIFQRILSQFQ